jgi:hypothetical protein
MIRKFPIKKDKSGRKTRMRISSHYYKCSSEYLSSISPNIEKEIKLVLDILAANNDSNDRSVELSQLLATNGWSFSQAPAVGMKQASKMDADPELCKTSSSFKIETSSDFAKKC